MSEDTRRPNLDGEHPLGGFHPAVAGWFSSRFSQPTQPQRRAWPVIRSGQSILVAAPTGSGKTLAAFLAAIDELVRSAAAGELADETRVVYVSPLKALSNDVRVNLEEPLAGIEGELRASGFPEARIRVLVRTGDTTQAERSAMVRRPPHIVVTTPESLAILLTTDRGRSMLQTTRSVIVDEIHAVAGSKRGSHLALTLERLEALAGRPLTRIGLSATQKPIDRIARFLVGVRGGTNDAEAAREGAPSLGGDGASGCAIVDVGHLRDHDVAIEMPRSPLESVMAGEVWQEIYDRLASLISEHRTTLIFVNTRRLAERTTRHLADRLGQDAVMSHHGSLSREQRHASEQRLKRGELRALVATASLELGIDIGSVDLVCQVGSPRSIATWLQRVGRSGHSVGGRSKGRIFPLSRDELVECAALLSAARRGELDCLEIPTGPLDILAQQIVAAVACEEWSEDKLYETFTRAWPYRNLARAEFDEVVEMLASGFTTRRGRRGAYLHRDRVRHLLRPRRGARLTAVTSGGAIPDAADYAVVLEPTGVTIGTLNEDFAVESAAGDIFQLGNASWRVLRVEAGKVRVEDARGAPPTIPFWLGEAAGRTRELSVEVSRLREEIDRRLVRRNASSESPAESDRTEERAFFADPAEAWLVGTTGISPEAARQIVKYLAAGRAALGAMPSQRTLVIERFFDESGGMQLVVHAPFGSRLNRAWGLSLRKRFCTKFNFELQAAANEDAIVLSLGPQHSFPLESVFDYLRSRTVGELLVQAVLDAPMFGIRWRWNASRALAVPRWRGGKKVPSPLLRMESEDLLAALFPDQLACLQDKGGPREIPDHPLVRQTIHDCLTEAMDLQGLRALLEEIERGELRLVARDLTTPSPFAHEILASKPYTFLDDAPLEERRTRAVMTRRWLDPATAEDLGSLDPQAIESVRAEAWPDARDADELLDALAVLGFVTAEEGLRGDVARAGEKGAGVEGLPGAECEGWLPLMRELIAQQRASLVPVAAEGAGATSRGEGATSIVLWAASERKPEIEAARLGDAPALVAILRSRLDGLGPITVAAIAGSIGLPPEPIEAALAALEGEGFALRGRFTPGGDETEWCSRRLLARIHRRTLEKLRREIEPVSSADFMRFLCAWQGVTQEDRGSGPESLARILEQLEGFSAPAAAWEGEILPARMEGYDPAWLDALCLSGQFIWMRAGHPAQAGDPPRGPSPIRTTPIAFLKRASVGAWSPHSPGSGRERSELTSAAASVLDLLLQRGASFFEEIAEGTGLLRPQVEDALAELVAVGAVTSDAYAGLRALLTPSTLRPAAPGTKPRRARALFGVERAGRWTCIHRSDGEGRGAERSEPIARGLLRRHGVVFRKLLERETDLPPWRDLLGVYRRLEARGEIRGGRFVDGFTGEQFALAEAVTAMRSIRKRARDGVPISLSAADPLNLIGIVTPGQRLPAIAANRLVIRDGLPVAILESGEARILENLVPEEAWRIRNALLRRRIPPQLRQYLGRSASAARP